MSNPATLSFSEIFNRSVERFGQGTVSARGVSVRSGEAAGRPWMQVAAERWGEVARFLHDEPATRLDMLRCITGLDYPDKRQLTAAYELMSFEHPWVFCVKVTVPRDKAVLPSVAGVWKSADWHEREAYDMVGLLFEGHPDSVETGGVRHPRRILLPEDWVGHPLRKDYVFPREYGGIPGSVEVDWAQKANYPK